MATLLDTSKPMTLEIRVGGRVVHAGTLRKGRLEESIYQCLIWSCPLNDPSCGMNACNYHNAWNPCKVNNIVYRKDDRDIYANDAGLLIWINKFFHDPSLQGLRSNGEYYQIVLCSLPKMPREEIEEGD
jgi:hypothetical protein